MTAENDAQSATRAAGFETRGPWLEERLRAWRGLRDAQLARETRLSWSRLGLFLAALAMWILFAQQVLLALAASATLLLAFVWTVRLHAAAQAQREFSDRLVAAAEESTRRLGGQVVCLRSATLPAEDPKLAPALSRVLEDGPVWPLTGQERDDLDLFAAPCGVFGLLNRTASLCGALRLRDTLLTPLLDPDKILARQEAVRWLADHPEQRLRMLAACATLRNEDRRLARFVSGLEQRKPLRLFAPAAVLRAWGVVSGLAVAAGAALAVAGQYAIATPLMGLLTLNFALYVFLRGPLREVLDPWEDTAWAVRGYHVAARQAASDLPASDVPELDALRTRLAAAVAPAALPAFAARVGWAEGGGFVQLIANCVYLHELHAAARLDQPLTAHGAEMLAGVAALAELEALLSLGAFAWEQPITCWPVPDTVTRLEITGGRHPLVDPARVIPNSVALDLERSMWIITGSNMAGKSTLLRMTGLSVVLAQCGSAVAAEAMRWRPLRLLSDLRARDDLSAGESYFLAEVRHLRRLVTPPPGDAPVLGLIDEPFRGTNSQDQSAASVAVARHLLGSQHLHLVATHDRHMTELADGVRVRNFHFRENLGANGMVFDYTLHPGPAQTRNALRVLEAEGYPPDLMRAAHEWLARTAEGDVYAKQ